MASSEATPTGAPPADPGPDADPGDGARDERDARRFVVAVAVLAVAVVLLLVLGVVVAVGARSARDEVARDEAAVAVARDVVVRLSSLRQDGVAPQIDGLLQRSTGPFRAQLAGAGTLFGSLGGRARFRSEGQVTSAALETGDARQATVLVTATSWVSNAAAPQATPRRYRLAVTLQWEGSTWLASGVDQVAA